MFYLTLILLLYRFYSNCDLTECNPSVVPAIYQHVYIYYFHTDYDFPYVRKHRLRYHFNHCAFMTFLQTLNCAYFDDENMLATESILSDNQMPYALNVCQIQRHNHTDIKVQKSNSVLKKNTKACADNGLTMRDHLSFHCLKRFVLFHSMEGKLHNGIAC